MLGSGERLAVVPFFHPRPECREEPAGRLKDGHLSRGLAKRGAITPA